MLYLIADFNGQTRLVGEYETLEKALAMSDNIGTLFSDGSPHPMRVTITIENTVGVLLIQTEFYNSYLNQTKVNDGLVERYVV